MRIEFENTQRDVNIALDVLDPRVDKDEAEREYGIRLVDEPVTGAFDAIILAVAHREFRQLGEERLRAWGKPRHTLHSLLDFRTSSTYGQKLTRTCDFDYIGACQARGIDCSRSTEAPRFDRM